MPEQPRQGGVDTMTALQTYKVKMTIETDVVADSKLMAQVILTNSVSLSASLMEKQIAIKVEANPTNTLQVTNEMPPPGKTGP